MEGGNIKCVRLLFIKVETDFHITTAQPFAATQLVVSLLTHPPTASLERQHNIGTDKKKKEKKSN